MWQKVSKSIVTGNLFKSSNLEDGVAYEFRVLAENMAGIGKPSKASEAMLALDPVDPPGQPGPLYVNKNVITIQWTKPEYDGGFKITGYTVEKRDLPAGRWTRANFTNIIETTFTVSGLTQDAAYEFRVIARNSAGAAEDRLLPPELDLDAELRKVVNLRAGCSLRLFVPIRGRPAPDAKWTKEDVDHLQEGCNYYFRVLAENEYGIGVPIETGESVKVSEKPQPPGKITLKDVTKNSVTLSWEKPEHDGGSRVVPIQAPRTSRNTFHCCLNKGQYGHHLERACE
ncbi:hypothetical protein CRUP_033927 [Coryphaenoides rupestris]|nr:hypothetical protein CRUP_033927 [Coryphaenoides rupestris]